MAPSKIDGVIGIVKAYTTRVGSGPFPTELKDQVGETIRQVGHEFGTTTGRPRRCGWLDAFAIKYQPRAMLAFHATKHVVPRGRGKNRYTHLINNFTLLNLTKLDVLSDLDEIKIATSYKFNGGEDSFLPKQAKILLTSLLFFHRIRKSLFLSCQSRDPGAG